MKIYYRYNPISCRMSENVGASTSHNPKGLHGLYRDSFTLPIIPYLTNIMTKLTWESHSRSWEANSYSYGLEILRFLRNPKVCHYVHKSPSQPHLYSGPDTTVYPVLIVTLIIMLQPTFQSFPQGLFLLGSPNDFACLGVCLSHARYMSCTSHPRLDYTNNIWWRVKFMIIKRKDTAIVTKFVREGGVISKQQSSPLIKKGVQFIKQPLWCKYFELGDSWQV
jgi:hypothetical protein